MTALGGDQSHSGSVGRGGPGTLLNCALIAVAVAWGIAVHWYQFRHAPLAIDEHVSFWIADGSSPGTLLERSLGYSATPPLHSLLQRVCLIVFGQTEWSLRLVPFAGYIAAAFALGWWLTRVAGGISGGLAALMLVTHPAVAAIATQGRPYGLGLLLSVLALMATERLSRAPHSKVAWGVWLIVNAGLVHTHYLFALLGISELAWLALGAANGNRVQLTVRAAIALTLIGATCLPGMMHILEERQELNWSSHAPGWQTLWEFFFPIRWVGCRDPVWWAIVVVPVILTLMPLVKRHSGRQDASRKADGRLILRLALWWAAPVAVLWGLSQFWLSSLAADRYLVMSLPGLTAAVGLLFSRLPGRLTGMAATIAWLAISGTGEQLRALNWNREGARPAAHSGRSPVDASWLEIARTIAQRSPGAIVLVGSGLTEMVLVPQHFSDPAYHDYVACRVGRMYLPRERNGQDVTRISLPLFWDNSGRLAQAYRERLQELSSERTPQSVWLVTGADTDLLRDSAAQAESLIRSLGGKAMETWDLPGVHAVQFDLGHK